MNKPMSRIQRLIVLALRLTRSLTVVSTVSFAQVNSGGGGTVDWLKQRISELTPKVASATEAGDMKSHAETPSIDSSSPTLVDRSNPAEFFNVALALASNHQTAGNGVSTGSVTTTLYALLAAVQTKSLIDPDFYREQRYLRRLSFTAGTAKSDLLKDGTSTDAALYGVRYNLLDSTDLWANHNRRQIGSKFEEAKSRFSDAQSLLSNSNADNKLIFLLSNIFDQHNPAEKDKVKETQRLNDKVSLFSTKDKIDNWIKQLSQEEKDRIQQGVAEAASQDAALKSFIQDIRNQLRKPVQLSIAYFTDQRKDGGADDHRAELILDWGFHKRWNWTINGSLEYRNVYRHTGGDRKGGRLATEMQYKLYHLDPEGSTVDRWVTFDFGGEFKATTGAKPYFHGQLKLDIPIYDGVSIPLVWSYETISQMQIARGLLESPAQKRFQFGLAFDPAKLKSLAAN